MAAAHLRMQKQRFSEQNLEWEQGIRRVEESQAAYHNRMMVILMRGEADWENGLASYREEWDRWNLETLDLMNRGMREYEEKKEELQESRVAWEDRSLAMSFESDFEEHGEELRQQVEEALAGMEKTLGKEMGLAWLHSFEGQKEMEKLEKRMMDRLVNADKKYEKMRPRMKDFFAMGKMTLQPTTDEELEKLERLNEKIEEKNMEVKKYRLLEMLQDLYKTQSEYLVDLFADQNAKQEQSIVEGYLFKDIGEQFAILGMDEDKANQRKIDRIKDVLFNHGLDGQFYFSGRTETSVSYSRVYISDVSLFKEALDTHSLVAFNRYMGTTYLPDPNRDWQQVKSWEYLQVQLWQARYENELSHEFGVRMKEIGDHMGEEQMRFMNEYAALMGEFMAGVAKADVPFYKKKFGLGHGFFSTFTLSSAFDAYMMIVSTVATIVTFGAAAPVAALVIGGIKAGKQIAEAAGDKGYYQEDMSWGSMFQQMGMAGLSFATSAIGVGIGDGLGKEIGATVAKSLISTTVNQVGGSLITCAASQGSDCRLDISDSLQGLAVSGFGAAMGGGIGSLGLGKHSELLDAAVGLGAGKLTTLAVNTAGNALHGKRIDNVYENMGGFSLEDGLGLVAGLGQDIHAGAKAQEYTEQGWSRKNAANYVKSKERMEYKKRQWENAMRDGDVDEAKKLEMEIAGYQKEMRDIEKEERPEPSRSSGMALLPIPVALSRGKKKEDESKSKGKSKGKGKGKGNQFVGASRAEDELGLAEAQREAEIEAIKDKYGVDTKTAMGILDQYRGEVAQAGFGLDGLLEKGVNFVKEWVAGGGEHEVKKGDTVSKLAKDNGVTVEQFLAANPHITDPNKIRIGQKLVIPSQNYANNVELANIEMPKVASVPDKVGVIYSETEGLHDNKNGDLTTARNWIGGTMDNRMAAGKFDPTRFAEPPTGDKLTKIFNHSGDSKIYNTIKSNLNPYAPKGVTHFITSQTTNSNYFTKWAKGVTPYKTFGPFKDTSKKAVRQTYVHFFKDVKY